MNQLARTSPFEVIRHEDEYTREYWSARELYKILGYSSSRALQNTVEKAKIACENSKEDVFQHFYLQIDVVRTGNGSLQKTEVYRLSRYACYLIIMNADPHKRLCAKASGAVLCHTPEHESDHGKADPGFFTAGE
jgi:DNA-damage-inducible protein D